MSSSARIALGVIAFLGTLLIVLGVVKLTSDSGSHKPGSKPAAMHKLTPMQAGAGLVQVYNSAQPVTTVITRLVQCAVNPQMSTEFQCVAAVKSAHASGCGVFRFLVKPNGAAGFMVKLEKAQTVAPRYCA